MSDIYLNFDFTDHKAGTKLAAVFQQQGWGVWCDAFLMPLEGDYVEVHMEELEYSKVVVMLWSRAQRKSRLAQEALKRSGQVPFIPVLLEKAELPGRFSLIPSFDLSDWDGATSHVALQNLLSHLRKIITPSSPPAAPPAAFEELSLSEIQESARRAIKDGEVSRPEDDARFKGVFISYRRNEAAAYAGRLYDRLAARFGKERVFIDTENVGWGEDFVEAVTAAAESCAVMIALVSRGWSRGAGGEAELDDYVRLEVATALGRKIRVIPILIQGASMPAPKELPEDLAPLVRRNALALSDTRWERDVEDLIKSLEKVLKD